MRTIHNIWMKHYIFYIALMLALLRFFIWDIQYITDFMLPKHDGLHGITTFATSMHSLRLSGDIAWWNPADISSGGWAQYFSGFLSPVAPTYGSFLFIATSMLVKILNYFTIVIPEYFLYIFLNSFVTPLITCYFLLKFINLFCKKSSSLVLIGGGYFFTGIGLWVDSWFYWQDQMFIWMILYATISLLFYTTSKHIKIFYGALICFVASANYWTLHNILFILTIIILYIISQETPVVFLLNKFKMDINLIKRDKLLSFITALNIFIWLFVIGSVFLEQYPNYIRGTSETSGYNIENVFNRAIEMSPLYLTSELFNPIVREGNGSGYNFIHYARYIGIGLLPLFFCGFLKRNKKILLFIKICIINLLICLVPGFLLPVWNLIFKSDQHYFYMYSHFFEISVLFLAVVSYEECIDKLNRKLLKTIGVIIGSIFIINSVISYNTQRRFILSLILLLLSTFLLYMYETKKERVWIVLFVILFLADTTRYYYESSLGDYYCINEFIPKKGEKNKKLGKAFSLDENNSFEGGLIKSAPPVDNYMWPNNRYLYSKSLLSLWEYRKEPEFIKAVDFKFGDGVDLHFYKQESEYKGDTVFNIIDKGQINYSIKKWGYNGWNINCSVQEDGYILFNVMYDENWEIYVDGNRLLTNKANINYTSIEIGQGEHVIELKYMPFARKLYPYASCLLVATLIILYICIKWEGRKNFVRSRRDNIK